MKKDLLKNNPAIGISWEEFEKEYFTPEEIAAILSKQALTIQEQIQQLSKSLQEIKLLKEEVLQMQQVDFNKYADIFGNLQMNNQYYRLIKQFDDSTLDHIRHRFINDTVLRFFHTMVGILLRLRVSVLCHCRDILNTLLRSSLFH